MKSQAQTMSLIKQIRREKPGSGHTKDTRWDRIRKKHLSGCGVSLKSDVVRRFIDMDFVGKNQERLLNGEEDPKSNLNPHLVMDLRHEMFQKIPRKLPLASVAHAKNLDKCIEHNLEVEQHYIYNELNKFRDQLERNHKRNQVKMKAARDSKAYLQLDNSGQLMRSLKTSAKHIEDFYTAPIEALAAVNEVCKPQSSGHKSTADEGSDKENKNVHPKEPQENGISANVAERIEGINRRTPSPLTLTDEMLLPMREAAEEHQQLQLRCVRFEQEVEVLKYQREHSSCSNTSDGIDSVISDLAEEALMELQLEEQAELAENGANVNDVKPETEEHSEEKKEPLNITGEAVDGNGTKHFLTITKLENPQTHAAAGPELATSDDTSSESTASNREQNVIIEQLFQSRSSNTNVVTMRKYFLKWIHFTTIEKIEKQNFSSKHDRVHMINVFLDKIRKEKVRITKKGNQLDEVGGQKPVAGADGLKTAGAVQITKKYQNKIKIQQDIIDLQRLKLERQERMIMQLKLSKLSEEAKDARQELKDELKTFMRSGDPKVKAKAKCLQLIGNLKDADDEEEFSRLQGKAFMVPKFLQNMQERALERSVRHEQARQRRLQQEAEREAMKIAAEEAKRQEDEEAKRMRIEALKERRRQEKMTKIIRERERQRAIENNRKSQEFCRRRLLKRVGIEGFRRLLQRKQDNRRKCEMLRQKIFKKIYFLAWRNYFVVVTERKIMRAEDLYNKILKRRTLEAWRVYILNERSKFYVAVDWFEFKLSESTFIRWFGYTKRQKMIEDSKLRQATSHHEWHLKWKVLDRWQRLPQILQLEKETEERRQRWRMKIWELLPDYTPNRDGFL